jgi:hypothetical protein
VATLIVAMCMLLRVVVAGHGNVAAFIVVGSFFVVGSKLPRGIPVLPGTGYDGQFYYRLSLDPLKWSSSAFGIRLDSYERLGRVGYPALVWLVSAGQSAAVPVMMVIVNLVALGVLVALCASLAQEAGRDPLWGLLAAAYFGLLWTISRDTTELVAIVFVVAGLWAIRRQHSVIAGILLIYAVLTRETGLVLIAALFLSRLVTLTRWWLGRANEQLGVEATPNHWRWTDEAPWVLPVLAFVGWQGAVHAETGHFPILASANAGVPFVGLASGLAHYFSALPARTSFLWVAELTVLVIIGALAARSLRSSSALLHERIAWFGYLILAVSLRRSIWLGDVGFRSLDELFVFSCLLMLFSQERLRIPALLTALAWVFVAVELVIFL